MSELVLDSGRAVVDPGAGAELRSLRSLVSDRELLFQAPWPPAELDRAAGEEKWTRGWRGGWQVLFPNAANACRHRGREHPFHGDAALGEFETVDSDGRSATLRWIDRADVALVRWVELRGASVTVETTIQNAGGEPFDWLLVEHLVLGGDLAAPGARIELDGRLWPLDADGRARSARADAGRWPEVDGEDWSLVPERGSRFGALVDSVPRAQASSPSGDLRVQLRWGRETFRSLWYWIEANGLTDQPWEGRTRCVGLEPSSAAGADGLAGRAAAGEVYTLEPGAKVRGRVELTVWDEA